MHSYKLCESLPHELVSLLYLQAALRKMSDPAISSNIHHTKVSLMIKLPDKQTTIMSVPGL